MVVTVVTKVHTARKNVQLDFMESSAKVIADIALIRQPVIILLGLVKMNVNLGICHQIVPKYVTLECMERTVAGHVDTV